MKRLPPPSFTGFLALAVFLFTMGGVSRAASLFLHWGLGDGAGTLATDDGQDALTPGVDVDNNRDGAYTSFSHAAGAPIWRTSGGVNNGGYLHFDGDASSATGYAMRYLESAGDLPSGGYSISMWVRINAAAGEIGGTGAGAVDFAGGGTPGSRYYGMSSYNDGFVAANHRFGNPADGAQVSTMDLTVANGQWHHLVGVFESSTSRTLYMDGVAIGTNTVSRTLINPDRFSIGLLDRRTTADHFSGDIDEISFYSGALTASEAQALYAAGIPEPSGALLLVGATLTIILRRKSAAASNSANS